LLHVGVVVVLRYRRGDRVLALGGDKQDSALEPGQHGEQEVQKNLGIRVPGVVRQRSGVDGERVPRP
jgi:hypothetical protein